MVAKVMIAEDNIALVSCYQNLLSKDENVRIQKYSHGLLLDECIHEYVVKTNVSASVEIRKNDEVVRNEKKIAQYRK